MRVPRFYQNCDLTPHSTIELSDDAVQHIARVLRMKTNDEITLFNGDGHEYGAHLVSVEKRKVSALITGDTQPERHSKLIVQIGQAISKGDRMDYAVQKSTELGMTSLTPLISERCEVKLPPERQLKRQQHWQQLSISACEQSLRTTIPTIEKPTTLKEWIKQCDAQVKLVLHHHTEKGLNQFKPPQSVALLVGPEGGLSEEEVALAVEAGFHPVAFGPRVMRTETAPITAQAILQYLWGDLG